jgi:hypothetical protein
MPDKALDPVEWELVRADIAMEKARLKANGDWAKWEKFQAQTNARFTTYARLAASLVAEDRISPSPSIASPRPHQAREGAKARR